jgi:glycosyltransferase involved in cell wall biosynthesis
MPGIQSGNPDGGIRMARACNFFVLPSMREGMSNCLLTAMYAGRCVLYSDIESMQNVLQWPEALVRVDDVADLAEKLQY